MKGVRMDYVIPNAEIQIGVVNGLDDRYMHTLYFDNLNDQEQFMSTHLTKRFDKQSYRRVGSGSLKIQTPYQNVYNCNYMRFKNKSSETPTHAVVARDNKWYYAFIIGVEYINENTTLISYEIDEMQTWFVGATVNPCLVEREHLNASEANQWKLHLEPEPISSGHYDLSGNGSDVDYLHLDEYTNYSMVVEMSNKGNQKYTEQVVPQNISGYVEGLYSGTYSCAYDGSGTPDSMRSFGKLIVGALQDAVNGSWEDGISACQIISAKMFPTKYVSHISGSLGEPEISPTPVTQNISFNMPTTYDSFIPENKKMFTYPYSYLLCCTANGVGGELKWELFDGDIGQQVQIRAYAHSAGVGEIAYLPLDYNGQSENKQHSMVVSNFPMVAITTDSYQAWLASGGETKMRTNAFTSAAGSAINTASGIFGGVQRGFDNYDSSYQQNYKDYYESRTQGKNLNQGALNAVDVGARNYAKKETSMLGSMVSALMSAPSQLAGFALDMYGTSKKIDYTFKDAQYQPRQVIGTPTSGVMVAHKLEGMYFYHCHVHDSEARRLDEFLTMYGYNIGRVKAPNLHSRTYWNFVKTNGASISGDMPASSMANIARILDGGITFWHGDYVGNYRIGYNGASNKQVITNPAL